MSRAQGTRGVQRQRLLLSEEAGQALLDDEKRTLVTDQQGIDRLAEHLDGDRWRDAWLVASDLGQRCDRSGYLNVRPLQLRALLEAVGGLAAQLSRDAYSPATDGDDEGSSEEDDEPAVMFVTLGDPLDEPTDEGEAFEREPIEDDDDDDDEPDPGDVDDRRQTFLRWSGR